MVGIGPESFMLLEVIYVVLGLGLHWRKDGGSLGLSSTCNLEQETK